MRRFCEWWIETVLLFGGDGALAVAYETAAILARDRQLAEVERRAASQAADREREQP